MNKIIIITLLLACVFCEPEYEEKDGVLVLTDDNFDAVVNHFEHVLVMFYAPWCGHCKKLHPEYEAAAQQLEQDGSEIRLANVDATVSTVVAGKFEVKGYPTLKFFINGTPMEYNGPREQKGIVQWVNKKTQPATTLLEDSDAVEKAKTDNEVVVVFFGSEDSDEFNVHSTVAKQFDDLTFHHVASSEVATENGVEGTGLVVFKQFDEGRNNFDGDWTSEALNEFVSASSTPTIMKFDQKAAQLIFGQGKTCLFVFLGDDEASESARTALNEASETLKGQVLMATSGVSGGLDARLAEYIGVTAEDVPCVRLVVVGEDLAKFNMETELTGENMVQFWQDFQAGNVQKSLKSEPVPETQENAVVVVVGLSWNDVVMDETTDVLVEYYAPWCGHCKALAPIYEALAQKLSVVDNLVIANMDATANEADGVNIKGFPTLKFYPANNKTPVDFSGNRDEAGLLEFLREKSSKVVNWEQLDSASEETTDETTTEVEEPTEVKDEL